MNLKNDDSTKKNKKKLKGVDCYISMNQKIFWDNEKRKKVSQKSKKNCEKKNGKTLSKRK